MTKSLEESEKCFSCGIGKYISNEQLSTSRKSIFTCDSCGHKMIQLKQTCNKCGKGKCIFNENESTRWEERYWCNYCKHEFTRPTGLADIARVLGHLPNLTSVIKDVVRTVQKNPNDERDEDKKPVINTVKDPLIPSGKRDDHYEFYSQVDVKPEYISEFIIATRKNRDETRRSESGNLKYDIYQFKDDRTKFILHEIYESQDAADKDHKTTAHYQEWKEEVEPMMAKDRSRENTGIPPGYKYIS